MKFAKEAWPYVLPFLVLGLALAAFRLPYWALASVVTGLLLLLFFRDPHRAYHGPNTSILAPADGLITRIEVVDAPEVGPGRFHHIVTFLSVFDVHVQKTPIEGEVVVSRYTVGKKVAAFRPDAGEINEKHLSVIRNAEGTRIGVLQIAGLLARRVVCYLKEGERVTQRQPMGVIKFSSRVDLYVPESYQVLVIKGDRVKNGVTPMAVPPSSVS
jgi:phosphatidylserine decarboxylase